MGSMNQPENYEAAEQGPSLCEYHRALIEEGIRQDNAGDMVEHQTLMHMAARWVRQMHGE
jgi:hypothetical protein